MYSLVLGNFLFIVGLTIFLLSMEKSSSKNYKFWSWVQEVGFVLMVVGFIFILFSALGVDFVFR